jgi:hypothetical protein
LLGAIQREGEVVHLVANYLTDLSAELAAVDDRDDGIPRRIGAATNSITAAPASIRAACRGRDRDRGTSTYRICTSIA